MSDMVGNQKRDSKRAEEVGADREDVKEGWNWQKGITSYPPEESRWPKSRVTVQRWESEHHKEWGWPVEGFRDHVTTDGSLLGTSVRGMRGTLDAELDVQRTIKRAELTDVLCLLTGVVGPTTAHVDNEGIIDGLWTGEAKCLGPKAKERR